MIDQVKKVAARAMGLRLVNMTRCVKACFTDDTTGEVTMEGRRVLADLRTFANLGSSKLHSFRYDTTNRLDPLALARIEGRREVVNRLLDFLELDPNAIRQFVEVDNERT